MPAEETLVNSSPTPKQAGWSARIEDQWLEWLAVFLLSVASLGAAWSGYQAGRWGGVQSTLYSQASAARIESTRESATGNLMAMSDLSLFNEWANAYAEDDQLRLDFYANRFSPELDVAMEAWLATQPLQNPDAPPGPISMPEYVQPHLVRAAELEAEAADLFQQGREANQQGDDYVLTTVFFATVLFFGGISARLKLKVPKLAILTLASGLLVISLVRLATFPIE